MKMVDKEQREELGYEKLASIGNKFLSTLERIEKLVRPPFAPPLKEFFGRKERE